MLNDAVLWVILRDDERKCDKWIGAVNGIDGVKSSDWKRKKG